MWRWFALTAVVCLCASPVKADTPCPPVPASGIVWSLEGDWLAGDAPVSLLLGVSDVATLEPASKASTSRIIVLQNGGSFFIRLCPRNAACVDECRPAQRGAAKMTAEQFSGVHRESGNPRYRAAMSRGSGWSDAVIAVDAAGAMDLADVFRGGTARPIRYRLCSIEVSVVCESPYAIVNWDGQSARVASGSPQSGLFRIVEDDGISDAWVRLVPADRAEAVRAQYRAGVEAIKTWALPESDTPLPSLDRLRRVVLASVGDER